MTSDESHSETPPAAPAAATGARPATPLGQPLVSLKNVNKHFGALHVLQDINLEVTKGEVVVVIGPSGSGKSTLCRAINRLETVDDGEILIDGNKLPGRGQGAGQTARRRRHGVPVVQPLRAQIDSGERHSGPDQGQRDEAVRGQGTGDGPAGAGGRGQPVAKAAGPALRRPATARGHRPGAGDETEGDALRRAHLGAGPGNDQRGAATSWRSWPRKA